MEDLMVITGWVGLGISIGGLVMWFKNKLIHNKEDHDRIEKKLDDHAESEGHKLTEMGNDIKEMGHNICEIRDDIKELVQVMRDK